MLMGERKPLSLSKSERLKNVKQIDYLFGNAVVFKAYPLIFSYLLHENLQQSPVQLLFSAPKRIFKKAVDRNRVKRVLRDRFRLLKPDFTNALNGKNLQAAFIYTSRDPIDYRLVDKSMKKIIRELHDKTGA